MKKIRMYIALLFSIIISLLYGYSNTFAGGWLEVPEKLDAKGVLEQYIMSNSPASNTDYTGNIQRLGSLFKKGKIYSDIKDDYLNSLLSNVHYLLYSKYAIDYGYGKFQLSDTDKNILKQLGILEAVKNFQFLELNADTLKNLNILTDPNAYNYFKNTLAPYVVNSIGLLIDKNKGDTKINSNNITTIHISGYPVLVANKTADNMEIIFKYLFTNKTYLNNIIAFEINYHGRPTIVIVGLPNKPFNVGNTTIMSSLALQKAQLQYIINGKIKYPKELKSCFSGIDASKINGLSSLQNYIINNCKALYPKNLDCNGTDEFIGNFNEGTTNQYTVVYGLDEKDGLYYVVPVKRFFNKRLVSLLPSNIYNSSNDCGYNLMLVDRLSKKIEGVKDNMQGTHRLVWSSRDQGWNGSCSKWTDNGGIFEGIADTNSFTDSCNVTTLPNGFLNKGNDLVINYGVYMTGDTTNMQLYYGLKDSSNNIVNMYEAGKYLGFDTIGKGLVTKDLNIGFNNGLYQNGVLKPRYWQVNTNIFVNNNNNKATIQNIEDKLIYNIEINGSNSYNIIDSIVNSSYFKNIFNNGNYNQSNLNRYPTLFLFASGSNSNNKVDLNYMDVGFNDYTTYYLYTIKTLSDGTQKLELQQSLNLDGYNIFFKDIGLDNYDDGDGTNGIFLTFSGQNNFFTFDTWTQTGAQANISSNIDIDALRVEFGGDGVGKYKKILHLKIVYDKTQNQYIIKQSDKGPLSETFIQGIQLGGILGDILKDCNLANFINNDLKDCSHNKLQPLNVDNDKEDIGNGFTDWDEWVYTSGSELRIFNNIVKKDSFGNYTVQMKEILYSNNLQYCKKEAQTIDYYKNHNSASTSLNITEGNSTYKGYSPDENKGVSIIFKQGDLKFVYTIDTNNKNFFTKTYILNQVISDSNNNIVCE